MPRNIADNLLVDNSMPAFTSATSLKYLFVYLSSIVEFQSSMGGNDISGTVGALPTSLTFLYKVLLITLLFVSRGLSNAHFDPTLDFATTLINLQYLYGCYVCFLLTTADTFM